MSLFASLCHPVYVFFSSGIRRPRVLVPLHLLPDAVAGDWRRHCPLGDWSSQGGEDGVGGVGGVRQAGAAGGDAELAAGGDSLVSYHCIGSSPGSPTSTCSQYKFLVNDLSIKFGEHNVEK